MTFIQLIETTTTRRDEMDALAERWRSLTEGRRTARRSTATHDQDRPDTYIPDRRVFHLRRCHGQLGAARDCRLCRAPRRTV
jgi:hypothetical protein